MEQLDQNMKPLGIPYAHVVPVYVTDQDTGPFLTQSEFRGMARVCPVCSAVTGVDETGDGRRAYAEHYAAQHQEDPA